MDANNLPETEISSQSDQENLNEFSQELALPRVRLLLLSSLAYSLIIIIGGISAYYFQLPILFQCRPTLFSGMLIIIWAFPLVLMLLAAHNLPWEFFKIIQRFHVSEAPQLFKNCSAIDFVFLALLAGTGEELLFRGIIQQLLEPRAGVTVAILITSAIFGMLHALNFSYFILTTMVSLYLGIIFSLTRDLFLVMGIHALYDAIALYYVMRIFPVQQLRKDDVASENVIT